jgi:hypothetical protein
MTLVVISTDCTVNPTTIRSRHHCLALNKNHSLTKCNGNLHPLIYHTQLLRHLVNEWFLFNAKQWCRDRMVVGFTVQSVLITTNVMSSNPAQARCTGYNIMWWYVYFIYMYMISEDICKPLYHFMSLSTKDQLYFDSHLYFKYICESALFQLYLNFPKWLGKGKTDLLLKVT